MLNFPEIETRVDAELLMLEGIQMEEMTKNKTKKRSAIVGAPGDSDEAAKVRFTWEHPKYV